MLTCYLMRLPSDVADPVDLATFVRDGQAVQRHDLVGPPLSETFTASLFVAPSSQQLPAWAPFLLTGFPDASIANQQSVGALLVVRRVCAGTPYYLAFSFGQKGHFLLHRDRTVPNFGMRAALNAISADHGADSAPHIKSFDSKRFQETTLHRRHQASRSVPIETLGVDKAQDIIRAVHGTPGDTEAWGPRIGGTRALTVNKAVPFTELPNLCDDVLALWGRQDYKQAFDWVDHVRPLDPGDEQRAVEEEVVAQLVAGQTDNLSFAPPEIIDWSTFRGFRFSFERVRNPVLRPEMEIAFLLAALSGREITVDSLKSMELRAQDLDGNTIYHWKVWDCLTATVEIGGTPYVLDGGDVFQVDGDYAQLLEDRLANVPRWPVALPPAEHGEGEPAYIDRMCPVVSGMHNVHASDKIRVPSQTHPIELCDGFHEPSKAFVHVKREFHSKHLSHLLSQGFVSADLLVRSLEFRTAVEQSGRPFLSMHGYAARDHTVVYAIVGRWEGRDLAQALPFFSKVNARRVIDDLESMGYQVAYAPVDIRTS